MAEYIVTIPIAGAVSMTVNADSEEEAKEAGRCLLEEENWNKMLVGESSNIDLDELEAYESIVEGNICHVNCIETTAERQKP